MSASKRKGTAWERRVVDYLVEHGHPDAERRAQEGVNDRGDVAGIPGWTVECKNAKRVELAQWMKEALGESLRAGTPRHVVVFPSRGRPTAEAHCVVPLWLLAELMIEEASL